MPKIISLDVGLVRIGVAVCDPLGLSIRPLDTLRRRSRREDFAALAEIVLREEAQAVVCGLPLNMDGSEGPQAKTVRKWAMRLAHALRVLCGRPLPVIFWDERLTTFAAQEIRKQESLTHDEDSIAAAIILQSYLDAQKKGEALHGDRIDLPPLPL